MFDFNKVNIKTRMIHGVLYGIAVPLFTYIADIIFDLSDLGWDYYIASAIGMFIFGFFYAGIALKESYKN